MDGFLSAVYELFNSTRLLGNSYGYRQGIPHSVSLNSALATRSLVLASIWGLYSRYGKSATEQTEKTVQKKMENSTCSAYERF